MVFFGDDEDAELNENATRREADLIKQRSQVSTHVSFFLRLALTRFTRHLCNLSRHQRTLRRWWSMTIWPSWSVLRCSSSVAGPCSDWPQSETCRCSLHSTVCHLALPVVHTVLVTRKGRPRARDCPHPSRDGSATCPSHAWFPSRSAVQARPTAPRSCSDCAKTQRRSCAQRRTSAPRPTTSTSPLPLLKPWASSSNRHARAYKKCSSRRRCPADCWRIRCAVPPCSTLIATA